MNRRISKMMILGAVLLVAIFALAACAPKTTSAPVATQSPVACPTAAACGPVKAGVEAPFQKVWAASGHADAKAPAFTHWDTASPAVVPSACATCHSSTGFTEFATTGAAPKDQPIGTTVTCDTCHSDAALKLTSVTFPSGVVISNMGPEARCVTCHSGRASMKQVDDQIAKFKVTDEDAPVAPLKEGDKTSNFSFINAHYFTAALTLYGTDVKGGYEYAGKAYDPKNQHVAGVDTCNACHNPHSLQVEVTKCAECHTNVKTTADLKNIREVSSVNDFNGNGDTKEGIAAEVSGVQDVLLKAIYSYAKDVVKVGIVYDGATYPYFLQDKDSVGKADKDDKGATIAYANWTARLLKAAFNYQVVTKDPGAYAHNSKYAIQLMYDSIADLNTKLTTKIDMSKMHRDDVGHFAGSAMAFRDWDATGVVPFACAKCHSATGLPEFIKNGGKLVISTSGTAEITGISSQPVSDGLMCTTCHNGAKFPELYAVANVPFPNGKTLTFSTQKDDKGNLIAVNSNICLECHQGRESTLTMNNTLAAFKDAPDKADAKLRFKNVHYFAAGATLFGTDAKGIYEYDGQTYVGRNMHTEGFQTCTDCHDKHTLEVKAKACAACHKVDDVAKIRMSTVDYDGSKDPTKPMADVIKTFEARLYAGIQKYAKEKLSVGILYDANAYPYFYQDKNNDGKPDVNDKGAAISYAAFSPRLLKAAYNLQYSIKDPGGFAHNPKYVLQVLYDSIKDIGGDVTGLTRPITPTK